jgi:hypothetical protein
MYNDCFAGCVGAGNTAMRKALKASMLQHGNMTLYIPELGEVSSR